MKEIISKYQEIISKYQEINIFILFLAIILILAINFKIYDILGVQSTITLFAVFVALGTGILTFFYNKKVLNQAKDLNDKALDHAQELNEKTLLQSEKNLRIQLLFEESRKSLFYLKKLIEESGFNSKNLNEFIRSSNAIYLPSNTKNIIEKLIREREKIEEEAPWAPPQPTKEELQKIEHDSYIQDQVIIQNMNDDERYRYQCMGKINDIKLELIKNVSDNLNKDPTEID